MVCAGMAYQHLSVATKTVHDQLKTFALIGPAAAM